MKAMSVPGLMGHHSWARAAVLVWRGSSTTSFRPRSRMAVMRSMESGVTRASKRLAPAMSTNLQLSTSAKGASPKVSR